MVCRSIRRIRCMGGKMGPVQKALLKLLQEAVPVGYVHILQIFELRQECSRSEGVVTVSFPEQRQRNFEADRPWGQRCGADGVHR